MTAKHRKLEEQLRGAEAEIASRSDAYDALLHLGRERVRLQAELEANVDETCRVVRDARPHLRMGEAAAAAGASRPTLYRWLREPR